MDHWSVSCPTVSLRDIMIEEQVMQDSIEKVTLTLYISTNAITRTVKGGGNNGPYLCLVQVKPERSG